MSGFSTKLEQRGTVRHCQSKEGSILWSYHEETRELPGEKNNARKNARCMQARKTMHGLDRQHKSWMGLSVEE